MSHVYSPSFHWAEDRQPSQFMDQGNHSFWTREYSKFRNDPAVDKFTPFALCKSTPPSKRGPRTAAQILKLAAPSNIGYSTRDNTKTLMIVGRRNEARSQ